MFANRRKTPNTLEDIRGKVPARCCGMLVQSVRPVLWWMKFAEEEKKEKCVNVGMQINRGVGEWRPAVGGSALFVYCQPAVGECVLPDNA